MIQRIIGDVYDSNVFIVSKNNSCIIIDAGANLGKVRDCVADKKVEGIFITHGHFDHCKYIEEYIKEFNSNVYCSIFAKEYMMDSFKNYSEGSFSVKDFSKFNFLQDSGNIKLENFKIFYSQLGGHSKSDMIFQIETDLFVGDLLIGRDIGRIDLYGGDKKTMIESLKYIKSLDYQVLHSGHGENNFKLEQDKYISTWLKFLQR